MTAKKSQDKATKPGEERLATSLTIRLAGGGVLSPYIATTPDKARRVAQTIADLSEKIDTLCRFNVGDTEIWVRPTAVQGIVVHPLGYMLDDDKE